MRVLLAGATGYIGQAVLRELVSAGHEVIALVRPGRALSVGTSDDASKDQSGTVTVVEAAITSGEDWASSLPETDVVISCLASRSGAPSDARLVEYETNRQLLAYAERGGGTTLCALVGDLCSDAAPRLSERKTAIRSNA